MMKYFRQGGTFYAGVYTLNRGILWLTCMISTIFYCNVIGKVGRGTKFRRNVFVGYPQNVVIGCHSMIADNVILNSETLSGWLNIGDNVQLSEGTHIDFSGGVTLERNVLISAQATIYSHDHGYDPRSIPAATPIIVEENAWVGYRAVILPSVERIGKNAIVGACATVTKAVPENAIVVGNPAKIVGYRRDLFGGDQ